MNYAKYIYRLDVHQHRQTPRALRAFHERRNARISPVNLSQRQAKGDQRICAALVEPIQQLDEDRVHVIMPARKTPAAPFGERPDRWQKET